MLISFLSILLGIFLSIYSLFIKKEPVFIFGWLLFYFSLMFFIWLLSLTPLKETPEERSMRIFSFILAAVIIGIIFLIIGYPLLHFYFR